mgnify:CR=1 FL=1
MNFVELGKKIYDLNNPREFRRFLVFVVRCCLNSQKIKCLEDFFSQSKILSEVAKNFPFVFEQSTRAFFYYKSTFDERIKLIEEHFEFLTQAMNENFLLQLYGGGKSFLWSMPLDENLKEMQLVICMQSGQKKEGLASIVLELANNTPVYQIMFWIAKDSAENFSMWIGALQGPNVENSKDLIKILTKKCHAYRTKNLILYAAQAVARALNLKKIYAVTNYGYYANNHIRTDRKLKTSFSDFWQECGGVPVEDKRFYELPLTENRKTFEEIPTQKRAVYRRRFELLDEIDAAIFENIQAFKRGD